MVARLAGKSDTVVDGQTVYSTPAESSFIHLMWAFERVRSQFGTLHGIAASFFYVTLPRVPSVWPPPRLHSHLRRKPAGALSSLDRHIHKNSPRHHGPTISKQCPFPCERVCFVCFVSPPFLGDPRVCVSVCQLRLLYLRIRSTSTPSFKSPNLVISVQFEPGVG